MMAPEVEGRERPRAADGTYTKRRTPGGPAGFELDVADLIDDHARECGGELSFAALRARWVSRAFTFVHSARLPELLEGEYVQMLYSCVMARIEDEVAALVERITALYVLYLLYSTQPTSPRVRVYVTPRQMDRVVSLVHELKTLGVSDGLKVLASMADDGAFAVGAVESGRQGNDESGVGGARAGRNRQKRRRTQAVVEVGLSGEGEEGKEEEVDLEELGSDEDGEDKRRRVQAAGSSRTAVDAEARAALEHLRRTRVPESFGQLCRASEAYGAAMKPIMVANNRSLLATTKLHELIRRQLVKFDEKLRAALRPEMLRGSAQGPGGFLPEEEDGAVGSLREGTAVAGLVPVTEVLTARLPLPGMRSLAQTPVFGSMPNISKGVVAGGGANGGEYETARAPFGRLDDSDIDSE